MQKIDKRRERKKTLRKRGTKLEGKGGEVSSKNYSAKSRSQTGLNLRGETNHTREQYGGKKKEYHPKQFEFEGSRKKKGLAGWGPTKEGSTLKSAQKTGGGRGNPSIGRRIWIQGETEKIARFGTKKRERHSCRPNWGGKTSTPVIGRSTVGTVQLEMEGKRGEQIVLSFTRRKKNGRT